MKILIAAALMGLSISMASAQQTPQAPASQPAAAPQMHRSDLRKKHIDSVAAMKKQQIDDMQTLRKSLKGKPEAEVKQAVAAKRKEQKEALEALKASNKAEMDQYNKEHPGKKAANKK